MWRINAGFQGAALALVCLATVTARAQPNPTPLALTPVASGIFVHQGVHEEMNAANRGAIANSGFIVGGKCVAVIDPGGSLAAGRALKAALREITRQPVCYVIYTHLHPDHVLGGRAFLDGHPQYAAHQGFPAALGDNQAYFQQRFVKPIEGDSVSNEVVAPTVLIDGEQELDLGSRKLKLQIHAKAHTDTDLTVYDEQTGTWWLGDLLFVERTPAVEGSLKGWLQIDEKLRTQKAERAVPGHGPASVPWPAGLKAQDRYLKAIAEQTRAAIKAGKTLEQALEQVGMSERENWRLFEEYHKRNVTRAYKELEWE